MSSKAKVLKGKKILIVSSDVVPYMPQSISAVKAFELGKSINQAGGQTRIFIPRYGSINERRHQLHEVIRLSGINLVINNYDYPLYIKVASIPKLRMQVYFIDSDDYFKRKGYLKDSSGKYFPDNDERMIFFTKGVIETVKKLNWVPNYIHLHGWFTSLFPLYLKTKYKNDLLFKNSKIISSLYQDIFPGHLNEQFNEKLEYDEISNIGLNHSTPIDALKLLSLGITYSDGVVIAEQDISQTLIKQIKSGKKPFLSSEESRQDQQVIDFLDREFS
ncbi:MAG: glycogen/starch synthase [Flavobacteriaceae bacterium]|nr:glycogen/starch synthase [Flavobacteriaceae bacterium]